MSMNIDLRGPLIGVVGLAVGTLILIATDQGCAIAKTQVCAVALAPVTDAAFRWQSLLGAVFALLAAMYSAWFVLRQIQQSDQHEAARLARRRRSQRALMPLVMSQICDFAEVSADRLTQALSVALRHEQGHADRIDLEAPRLDAGVFKDITAMIEAAHDDEADPYIELLSELQVHLARWRGIANDQGRRRDKLLVRSIEEELVDAAEIYARASNLLASARPAHVAEGAATTRVGGIFLLGLHGLQFDGAAALAAQYDENAPLTAPPRGL